MPLQHKVNVASTYKLSESLVYSKVEPLPGLDDKNNMNLFVSFVDQV